MTYVESLFLRFVIVFFTSNFPIIILKIICIILSHINDLLKNMIFLFLDWGAAFTFGRSRFGNEKFWIKNDPILQVACGDEHTALLTGIYNYFNISTNLIAHIH